MTIGRRHRVQSGASGAQVQRVWYGVARVDRHGVTLEGVASPWPEPDQAARILVMTPVGPTEWLDWEPATLDRCALQDRVLSTSTDIESYRHVPTGRLAIAVCTRDRPGSLSRCLDRLLGNAVEAEVLVVDNAPRTADTARVVDEVAQRGLGVRRVVEPRPGLSRARNRALVETDADYVAFTDDDVLADSDWPAALHRGFARGVDVGLVTGLVPPAEITTAAQAQFQRKMRWSRSLERCVYSLRDRGRYSWPFPYAPGHFGTGANFAVRRTLALDLGGFNPCLGAGTRTEGGEDLEMFVRVVLAGHELAYEPAAVAWHVHRVADEQLKRLMYGYGKGLSAVFLANLIRGDRADAVVQGARAARNLGMERRREIGEGLPLSQLAYELAGVACGPIAYGRELWSVHREASARI